MKNLYNRLFVHLFSLNHKMMSTLSILNSNDLRFQEYMTIKAPLTKYLYRNGTKKRGKKVNLKIKTCKNKYNRNA